MTVTFDTSLLLGWYQAQSSLSAAAVAASSNGKATAATAATAAAVPTAPWAPGHTQPKDSALVTQALAGKPFIDEKAAKLDVANADADYKKLFAINQGLLTLEALANAANDPKVSSYQLDAIQSAFSRGMSELGAYVQNTKFDNFRLTQGIAANSVQSAAGVITTSNTYVTAPLATGSSADPVAAFQGATQFSMTVNRPALGTMPAKTTVVNFDLSEMGSTTRSMSEVAKYMNSKLSAANVGVRVDVDRQTVPAETTTVNGKSVEITPATTELAFSISGLSLEKVTFSAPATEPAVYVAQTAGDPDPDGNATTDDGVQQQELLKLDAGSGADGVRRPGDTNYVAGRAFSEKLPDGVTTVHQMVTGADGSVYMIADGSGTVDGQPIKGDQDAVLLKYDAAGALIYSRTLGAGVTATGASLAVAADGKVAIAGSITGQIDQDSGPDAAVSDSFVTIFDKQGQELWTNRQGALAADEAQAVAFDAAGNVYVAGQTQGTIGVGGSSGGKDAYLRAFNASGKIQSTVQFGSSGDDKVSGIVVNGTQVLVAGQDGPSAVVRSVDITNPKQMSVIGSRNLGSLGGGSIAGLGLDGAGNLLIGGSSGAALSVGTTTLAKSGGLDAFGLRISTDLTSTASDAVAYYGGSGADRTTAATVANGQVWLTGTSKTDLPGLTAVGKQDGFVAALDVGAGAVTYAQRFTAKDRIDAPEAIAVDASGGSALDRLGFPKGQLQYDDSTLITAVTSVRAGDQFKIRMGTSKVATTITIAADETMASLQTKIRQAGLYGINVTTSFNGTKSTLQLKPAGDRQTFELLNGPAGRDALEALGVKQAVVRNTTSDKTKGVVPADGRAQIYGLHLDATLDLASPTDIKAALDSVDNALTTVRAIYADLKQAATPKDPLASVSNTAIPAYMQAKIADYSSALARLTGGSSDGSLASLIG